MTSQEKSIYSENLPSLAINSPCIGRAILWQWIELGDWLPCGFSTGEHLEFCCGCFVSCCGSNSAIQSRQANWRLITRHIWKTLPTSWTSSLGGDFDDPSRNIQPLNQKNQHESTPDFNQTWLFYIWITTDQWGLGEEKNSQYGHGLKLAKTTSLVDLVFFGTFWV